MSTLEEAIHFAVEAVGQGKLSQGKAALSWVLRQDPSNAVAWFWMACCVSDDDAKSECYRRASHLGG